MGRDGIHQTAPRPARVAGPVLICVGKRSLWEQGIHPREPGRLKFFNDKRFETVKVLWQRFYKRWSKKHGQAVRTCVVKAIEPRLVQEAGPDKWTIQWESTAQARADQEYVRYWQWIRVYEYYKDRFMDERYERQEIIAQKVMGRQRIDRMMITYNS